MQTRICKCGTCGLNVPEGSMYIPGHDAIHRSKLIERAGGVDNLEELLILRDNYIKGEIGEGELAQGIRKLELKR